MAARPAAGPARTSAVRAALESFALGLPGAWPDTPWGDSVVKVGAKIFVFLGHDSGDSKDAMITVKVPESHDHAMSFPGAAPTGYGLGKAGWVTIPAGGVRRADVGVLRDFVEESYRAVAPKKLVKELDGRGGASSTSIR